MNAPAKIDPLRILVVVYPGLPTPPPRYGGIERVVSILTEGLVGAGHHVTLMAGAGSQSEAHLITYSDHRYDPKVVRAWAKASFWWRFAQLLPQFDVVNWHSRGDYFFPARFFRRIPKVVTFHNPIVTKEVELYRRHGGDSVTFVALSKAQAKGKDQAGRWETIPSGIPQSQYRAVIGRSSAGYLAFLGRLTRYKGVHTAIDVARATGHKLKIAGNIVETPEDLAYFRDVVEPHLGSDDVEYIGEVNDEQKEELLQGAKALLFPIEWEEPLGLVILEALACGTPTVAFGRGAVPEVIDDGLNGFICGSADEMMDAVRRISEIDRTACRQKFEAAFSLERYVDRYQELFSELVHASRNGPAA